MTATLALFADQVTSVAREVGVEGRLGGQANVPGAAGNLERLTGNVNLLAANLTTQVRAIAEVATAVTKGDLTRSIQVDARGEVAELKDNINTMIGNLRLTTEHNTDQDWLKTNLAKLTSMLQGQRDLAVVGRLILSELTPLVNAQLGASIRWTRRNGMLRLLSVYADDAESGHPQNSDWTRPHWTVRGDKNTIVINDISEVLPPIGSVGFKTLPRNVIVLPILFENDVKAVIELASLERFTSLHRNFLDQLTASIAIVLNSIEATMQTEGLLKQSQELAGELQTQQKELQQTNEQLEMKAQQLEERNVEVERKNQEIEQARRALEDKATELALTSKYKSEFLANMSHELRTPLNSILILGQQLGENPDHNLTPKQVEYARTIHGAGSDLQNLINDILDLSKIESGTVSVDADELMIEGVVEFVARPFRHEADTRSLSFELIVEPDVEKRIFTDFKRLQQILKNLLSNAFKFTERGGVTFRVARADNNRNEDSITFAVTDTGIGIAPDKQKLIFEAFQQADASTSRRYGGTGLGLAISRELANLLGGEIHVQSTVGRGSTFKLTLPSRYAGNSPSQRLRAMEYSLPLPSEKRASRVVKGVADDRISLTPGDPIVLIVEDDVEYSRMLMEIARRRGFKALVATTGAEALELAATYQPSAISLDILLPDMLGWGVLSHLKRNPMTRHIPIQIVSADDDRQHGLSKGAFSFLPKPTSVEELEKAFGKLAECLTAQRKKLLIVEDDPHEGLSISALLEGDDIDIAIAGTGSEALMMLRNAQWDCLVLDLKLPDMTGFELLDSMTSDPGLAAVPVVVFTGRELTPEEDAKLRSKARSVVVKGVESRERLFDETALFLHRAISDLDPAKRNWIERLHKSNETLENRTVLVVDDDARNIFALSSLLEQRGMKVLTATNGRDALSVVASTPNLAIVLIDIMMPEMDGYQVIGALRRDPGRKRLPIIALTAKAMKGDREKCLEAGASDYLAKPVDTEQLLATLRVWLHR